MADLELFGTQQQQQPPAAADNGALDGAEEDPAAAFLAQQENEIAGIENDEGYSILESGEVPAALQVPEGLDSGTGGGTAGPAPPLLPVGRGLRRTARCLAGRGGEGSRRGGASQLPLSLGGPVAGRWRCRRGPRLGLSAPGTCRR